MEDDGSWPISGETYTLSVAEAAAAIRGGATVVQVENTTGDPLPLDAVVEALRGRHRLTELVLRQGRLAGAPAEALFHALATCDQLISVRIFNEGVGLGVDAARAAGDVAAQRAGFETLTLAGAVRCEDSMRALTEAISRRSRDWPPISLDVQGSVFEADGWTALCNLVAGGWIDELDVARCECVGDAEVEQLSRALRDERCALVSLSLFKTAVGDAGAATLANALPGNRKLQFLNLFGCDVSDAGGRALCAGIEQNWVVDSLCLVLTQVSPEVLETIEQLLGPDAREERRARLSAGRSPEPAR